MMLVLPLSTITMDEFSVQAGDGEKTRYVPIKHATSIPFEFLQRSSENVLTGSWSTNPWTPFTDSTTAHNQSAVICKMFEANRRTSHLAVVKHVGNDVWTTCKLDKSLRVKDVKALADTEPKWKTSLDQCQVVPDWQCRSSMAKLSLDDDHDYDDGYGSAVDDNCRIAGVPPSPSHKPPEPTSQDLEDPILTLQYKYFELLYVNQTMPLVHFVKSTLARLRQMYRQRHQESKADYKERLNKCLLSVVLKADQFDKKYDLDVLEKCVKEGAEPSVVRTQVEQLFVNYWLKKIPAKDVKKHMDQTKVRELQLQVLVLMEMLALSPTSSSGPEKGKRTPQVSLIRRKRSKKPPPPDTIVIQKEDPDVLVDLAFDRLCIWQTLANTTTATKATTDKTKQPDVPYDLCKEVLIPYFGKKLPVKAKLLARKSTGSSKKAHKSKSGARTGSIGDSTVDSTDHTKSLMHYITPAAVTQTSTGPGSIDDPHATANGSGAVAIKRRATLLQSQKREVDMSAPTKKRRSQQQPSEEELRAAVRNISKPNREAVTRELFGSTAVKKRTSWPASSSSSNAAVLQVAAADTLVTPSMNRKRIRPVEFTTPVKRLKFGDDDAEQVIKSTPRKQGDEDVDRIGCSDTDEDG